MNRKELVKKLRHLGKQHSESPEDTPEWLAADLLEKQQAEIDEWRRAFEDVGVTNWVHITQGMTPREAVRVLLEQALDLERDELKAKLENQRLSYAMTEPDTTDPYYGLNPTELRTMTWDSRPNASGNFGYHLPRGIHIIHVPTGLEVQEDSSRSPHKNRDIAMRRLAELIKESSL